MSEQKEVEAIEAKLRLHSVTAKAFLAKCEVSASTWHRIKTGENIPNGATMKRIREAADLVGKVKKREAT